MYFKSNKKGFTLIEMLMVVFIIGLLATVAVGGYTRYKKISLLELSADNVVSNIYGVRDSVRYGDSEKACLGLQFGGEVGQFSISKVKGAGSLKKVWNPSLKKWVVAGCSDFVEDEVLDIDGQVIVNSIFKRGGSSPVIESLSGGGGYNSCIVAFEPPNASLYVNCDGNRVVPSPGEVLNIVLMYGEESGNAFKRIIQLDLESAIANVKTIEEPKND